MISGADGDGRTRDMVSCLVPVMSSFAAGSTAASRLCRAGRGRGAALGFAFLVVPDDVPTRQSFNRDTLNLLAVRDDGRRSNRSRRVVAVKRIVRVHTAFRIIVASTRIVPVRLMSYDLQWIRK